MKTITMNPTWEFATRILLECIKNGCSESAKAEAEAEIMRMAKAFDNQQRLDKAIQFCDNTNGLRGAK